MMCRMPFGVKQIALVGCALGLAVGAWNLIAFWRNPLDDSLGSMLIVYAPMFISWMGAGFVAARRTGRLADAVTVGTVFALSTFAIFWIANSVRVNLFLDTLREWPGWQHTMVARYRESGFDSFRAFTNYEYVKDAPLKLAVPTAIGAMLASIGGLAGVLGHTTSQPRSSAGPCEFGKQRSQIATSIVATPLRSGCS